MADFASVSITGDRKVALRFDQFPEVLRGRLKERITHLTDTLRDAVRAQAPQSVQIYSKIFDDPDGVSGYVAVGGDSSADFAKAGALEWGAPGKRPRDKVKAHTAKLDHAWGNKLTAPITVIVQAHRRQANIVAKRFLRGPLEEQSTGIEAELQKAVSDATAEGDE